VYDCDTAAYSKNFNPEHAARHTSFFQQHGAISVLQKQEAPQREQEGSRDKRKHKLHLIEKDNMQSARRQSPRRTRSE